jgi:hypothetical protein
MILGKIHNWRRKILNLPQRYLKWLGLSKPIKAGPLMVKKGEKIGGMKPMIS